MRGGLSLEVNEAYATRTCSACGAHSGPKGIAGLGIQVLECVAVSAAWFICVIAIRQPLFSVSDWIRLQKELYGCGRAKKPPV
jgi:hypothetical protein